MRGSRATGVAVVVALATAAAMAADPAPPPPPPVVATLAPPTAAEVREIDAALVACGTRHSLSSWTDPRRGIGCARDRIVAYFTEAAKRDPAAKVVVDKFEATSPRTKDQPAPLENVLLVLEGSDPALKSTVFLVSGHYDSMCSDVMDSSCDAPGADDDASGSTVSIAAARMLAGRPRRATIVCATVAGEEQGLLGGKRLLEWAQQQGLKVGALLNHDIVGATNGSQDRRPRVFSGEDPFAPQRQLGLWLEEFAGSEAVRLVFRKDRFGRGGDHLPFVDAGLPAVRFTEPREDYRHQHQTPRTESGAEYGDLQKFMDFEFLAQVAATNAQALLRLANAPAAPAAVIVEGAVQPDASVSFEDVGADPERAGFEILVRDTTEVRWSQPRKVLTPGSYKLEGITIDDRLFAVRAVGKNGLRSIAVDAKPVVKRPAGTPPPSTPPATPPPPK